MTKYHKHHIIPKHMGGSDDPSNIVSLTIEEHTEAHKKLYEEYGKIEDKVAWKLLSSQILTEDDNKEFLENRIRLSKIGLQKFLKDESKASLRKERIKERRKHQIITKEHRENISKGLKLSHSLGKIQINFTEERIKKIQENYHKNNCSEKMALGRKKSLKWLESVSSIEKRKKQLLSSPKRKEVSFFKKIYPSMRDVVKHENISYFKLRKVLFSENTNDNIFFC